MRGLGCEAPTGTGLFPANLCRGKSCLGPRKAGNRTYVTDGTKQGANSLLYSSASSSTRMRLDSETTDWCRPTSVAGELTTIRARKTGKQTGQKGSKRIERPVALPDDVGRRKRLPRPALRRLRVPGNLVPKGQPEVRSGAIATTTPKGATSDLYSVTFARLCPTGDGHVHLDSQPASPSECRNRNS